MSNIWDAPRLGKQQSRVLAAEFSPRTSALYMPADSLRCVLTAEDTGMISPQDTRLFLVERDKAVCSRLKSKLRQTHWNNRSLVHCGSLEGSVIPFNLDYAWIDLNGTIGRNLGWWIGNVLSPKLKMGAAFCVTQEYCWRNNSWLKSLHRYVYSKFDSEYTRFRFEKTILGDKYLSFVPFLICSLLRDRNVFVAEPFRYADTIDMVLFRFVVGTKTSYPTFPQLEKLSCPV